MLTGNKSLPGDSLLTQTGTACGADGKILLIPAEESRTRSHPPYTIADCLYFGISDKSEDSPCSRLSIIRNTRQHNRCQPCTHPPNRQFLPVRQHRPTAFPKRSPRHPATPATNPLTSTTNNKIHKPRPQLKNPPPAPSPAPSPAEHRNVNSRKVRVKSSTSTVRQAGLSTSTKNPKTTPPKTPLVLVLSETVLVLVLEKRPPNTEYCPLTVCDSLRGFA